MMHIVSVYLHDSVNSSKRSGRYLGAWYNTPTTLLLFQNGKVITSYEVLFRIEVYTFYLNMVRYIFPRTKHNLEHVRREESDFSLANFHRKLQLFGDHHGNVAPLTMKSSPIPGRGTSFGHFLNLCLFRNCALDDWFSSNSEQLFLQRLEPKSCTFVGQKSPIITLTSISFQYLVKPNLCHHRRERSEFLIYQLFHSVMNQYVWLWALIIPYDKAQYSSSGGWSGWGGRGRVKWTGTSRVNE